MGWVEGVEFCYVSLHVPEVVTLVDFLALELVKVGQKFAFGGSNHHLQLSGGAGQSGQNKVRGHQDSTNQVGGYQVDHCHAQG